jgi:ubiquinone biosynthesis protein
VHAATLPDGREVVVKVLRPDIEQQIDADIALLDAAAGVVERLHPRADKIRPREVVAEIEPPSPASWTCNARRQRQRAAPVLGHSPDLYVPEVVWSHTAACADAGAGQRHPVRRPRRAGRGRHRPQGAGGQERARVLHAGVPRQLLPRRCPRRQHLGDDPARAREPRIIALDFGIVGQLSDRDQYYLAENFMAIFRRDYRRIAELHVQAGWMPATVRIDELEAAVRAVCEPYFTRPLSEISLAEVLVKLFRTAQKYQLTLQPQLILLQKTLLNVEGWAACSTRTRHLGGGAPGAGAHPAPALQPRRLAREFRRRLPAIVTQAPDMPQLVHDWLQQQVDGRQQLEMRSAELAG